AHAFASEQICLFGRGKRLDGPGFLTGVVGWRRGLRECRQSQCDGDEQFHEGTKGRAARNESISQHPAESDNPQILLGSIHSSSSRNIPMALGATNHVFSVRLSDVDRGIYETLELRLARHPSESADFLVTRLLAYCLEYTEGIAFSKGLSDPDEPAIVVRD